MVKKENSENQSKKFECQNCNKIYIREAYYKKHIQTCKKSINEDIEKSGGNRKIKKKLDIATQDLNKKKRVQYIEQEIENFFNVFLSKLNQIDMIRVIEEYELKPQFDFIYNNIWNVDETQKIQVYLDENLTYSQKKMILQDQYDYWIEFFNQNSFTFPRIHSFEILMQFLNSLIENKKNPFNEADGDEILPKIRETIAEESAGGKARDIIKLCRWLGIITVYDIDENPLRNIITRKGMKLLDAFKKKKESLLNDIQQDILLSCKFYSFHWVNEKDQLRMSQHKIRPFNYCVRLMNEINQLIKNLHLYLTLFRTRNEDIIPSKKVIEIFNTVKSSMMLSIKKAVFERALIETKELVDNNKNFTSFYRDLRKKKYTGNKFKKGFGVFKENYLGYKLVKKFYKNEIEWAVIADQLRINNIKDAANREAGAFSGFLRDTSIIETINRRGYLLTEIFKKNIEKLLTRTTIWYSDIVDELGIHFVLYVAYIIEFLNGLFVKANKKKKKKFPVTINIQDFIKYLIPLKNSKKLKSRERISSYIEEIPDTFIDKILNFLIKNESVYKIGDSIKISNIIDFDIEYDVPRYRTDYTTIRNILKDIIKKVKVFDKYEASEFISYIDFDKDLCSNCIIKNDFSPPCLIACKEEMQIQRMNFIEVLDKKGKKWRPITCFGCKNCTLYEEPSIIKSVKYPICRVCPTENILYKTPISDRPGINEEECISCLLCGFSCKFNAIIYNENLIPKFCDPNKCTQSCVRACDKGAITIKDLRPDKNYLDLLYSSICNSYYSFKMEEFNEEANNRFLHKINENENLILNPWISLLFSYFINCDTLSRFEKLPNDKEMDICLHIIKDINLNSLIYELKINKGDPLVKALMQVEGYIDTYIEETQINENMSKGYVIKDLSLEIEREKKNKTLMTWKKHLIRNISEKVKGNLSPDCLWRILFNYYQGKQIINFTDLIQKGKSINLDLHYFNEYKKIEI